jgi:arabinofuranosyltransferase
MSNATISAERNQGTSKPRCGTQRPPSSLVWIGSIALAYFILKVSWLADDAYITLRTVDNLLNGFGLRWNVAERVQVYTHPLWMLLLVPFKALLSSSILALMVPGWLTSCLAFPLLLRSAKTPAGSVVAFCVLALSQSVIDFSTSGLENPLSHLLVIGLLILLPSAGSGIVLFSALSGLLLLNRLDLLPLIAPLVGVELWSSRSSRRILKILGAASPLLLWLIFSAIYYGSPFPNTYFAKVAAGIPSERILTQGVRYFLDIILYEPLTLALVAGALIVGLRSRKVDQPSFLLAIGLALHLAYIFKVGGDFMNARFLTPDVVASAWIAMRATDRLASSVNVTSILPAEIAAVASMLAVIAGLLACDFHSFASRKAESVRPSSITDERQFYFGATGLWPRLWAHLNKDEAFEAAHPWADLGRKLSREHPSGKAYVHINMGFLGYYAGPRVHIVDGLGLTDPFVARLPVDNFWTAGHGGRIVPDEYVESLNRRRNIIADPRLHQLFDDLTLATRTKELLSARRFKASWRLNTGFYRDVGETPKSTAPPDVVDGATAQRPP